jgi:uncharacterized protein (TIGR00251 family)
MDIIKNHPEGILLAVTVQPRASCNQIAGIHGNALKIKLTAPPVDNAANKMCVQYLAKCLGLPKSAVEIISGHTSRSKQLLIRPKAGTDKASEQKRLKGKIKALTDGK